MNNDKKTNITAPHEDWDRYWHGTSRNVAFIETATSDQNLHALWKAFFSNNVNAKTSNTLLDIASGHGIVADIARDTIGNTLTNITHQDISESALRKIKEKHPTAVTVLSDASKIPLPQNSFDWVVSQFGVEYAGEKAIFDSAKFVAPNGHLGLVMHLMGGGIHTECGINRRAIEELLASNLIETSRKMFATGYDFFSGSGSRAAFDQAAKAMEHPIRQTEAIMDRYGKNVAGNTVAKTYTDISIHARNMNKFNKIEIDQWLEHLQEELEYYKGRMSSMCRAAVSEDTIVKLQDSLVKAGFQGVELSKITLNKIQTPSAWFVSAHRP